MAVGIALRTSTTPRTASHFLSNELTKVYTLINTISMILLAHLRALVT
jgi:hypothetical protein